MVDAAAPAQANAVSYQTYQPKKRGHNRTSSSLSLTDPTALPTATNGAPKRPLSMLGALPTVASLQREPVKDYSFSAPVTPDASLSSNHLSLLAALQPAADQVFTEKVILPIEPTPPAAVVPLPVPVTPPRSIMPAAVSPTPALQPLNLPPITVTPDQSMSTPSMPPSPSSATAPRQSAARPASTFRRIPAKTSAPTTPSLLSPARSMRVMTPGSPAGPLPLQRASELAEPSYPSSASLAPVLPQTPIKRPESSASLRSAISPSPSILAFLSDAPSPAPSVRQLEPLPSPPTGPSPANSRVASPAPTSANGYLAQQRPQLITPGSSASSSRPAPYRPGFQPKGVYRPRTDEFIATRAAAREAGSIEQQRLERRLDKLVDLHFSPHRPKPTPSGNRRASSLFELDLSELKNKSTGELLRGVLDSSTAAGRSKSDIRSAEQTITPWEADDKAKACRLCSAPFHPITNRKHHCRLCGRIICALPPKMPQRAQTCSLLFVSDSRTGAIEEVGEGVDYGVQKRGAADKKARADEDKFLRGVRICRDCRPTLQRKQYTVEQAAVPAFSRLHDAMIYVEKEIESTLPAFQEMLVALSTTEAPQSAEAKATRKRLLDSFADYDALSKRIQALPCPPGSSQERVQAAIRMRANLFLQQHMFPLQALPKPKLNRKPSAGEKGSGSTGTSDAGEADVDAQLAMQLQPLLEQEKLLESMVAEARQRRKFEDARTLQANLEEIRVEIDKLLENGQVGVAN